MIVSPVIRAAYPGPGAGPFSFPWLIFAGTDLEVTQYVAALNANVALNWGMDFTINPAGIGNRSGGAVTLVTALTAGDSLTLRRNPGLGQDLQLRDIRNQGTQYPSVLEDAFDYLTMMVQRLDDDLSRALKLPVTSDPSLISMVLPTPAPGDAIVWNAAGTGLTNAALSAAQLAAWQASNQMFNDVYTAAHGDFTAGVTTHLTLSQTTPGSATNLSITFDVVGVVTTLQSDDFSLAGNVVTFVNPITAGTTRVEIKYLQTYQVNAIGSQNVTYVNGVGIISTVQAALRILDASNPFNVKNYGAVGDGMHNDTTMIQAAATACDAAGGGTLFFPPGNYLIMAPITVTRKVQVTGSGPTGTTISAATQLQLKIKGAALSWGGSTVEGITFNQVDIILGETNADDAQGTQIINCTFVGCTYSIYFGWNCFFTLVDRCKMVDCTYGSFVDATTAGTSSGAMLRWRACEVHDSNATGLAHYGIMLSGAAAGGYELIIDNVEFQALTVGGLVVTGGTNRSVIAMTNIHFELMGAAAYLIINDGAIIRLNGFWTFSGSEAGWIKSTGGRTTIANGFGHWLSTKFALITGGVIAVDADSIYSPARWWGDGMTDPWVAGSTIAGAILAGRSPSRGWMFLSTGALTDGAPNAAPIAARMPGDGNNRVYEVLIASTTVTSDNTVRFNFTDGTNNANCDVLMPLFVGRARIRITWIAGVSIQAEGIFSGTAPDATTTKGLDSGVISDTLVANALAFLNISTLKSGATCATVTVSDIQETIIAPFTADA